MCVCVCAHCWTHHRLLLASRPHVQKRYVAILKHPQPSRHPLQPHKPQNKAAHTQTEDLILPDFYIAATGMASVLTHALFVCLFYFYTPA